MISFNAYGINKNILKIILLKIFLWLFFFSMSYCDLFFFIFGSILYCVNRWETLNLEQQTPTIVFHVSLHFYISPLCVLAVLLNSSLMNSVLLYRIVFQYYCILSPKGFHFTKFNGQMTLNNKNKVENKIIFFKVKFKDTAHA